MSATTRAATLGLAALGIAACGDPEASASARGAAYTNLYEALGRPAALRLQGDSVVIVTRMVTRQMYGMDRAVAARAAARTVASNWRTSRLAYVVVVFRDATRLGPFIVRTHDDSVRVDDATPAGTSDAPTRLP